MEGKEVFNGQTEKGLSVIIRYPTLEDVKNMQDYINTLSKEQTFIRMQGEQISFDEEKEFVTKMIKKIDEHKGVMLLVFTENRLIGICDINLRDRTERHEGVFGISMAKEYRGKGVGRLLMKTTLDEAKRHLQDLRIVTLSVYDGNDLAQKMYEEFGFEEYGKLPEGIYYKGNYIDHIYMYRKVH